MHTQAMRDKLKLCLSLSFN